MKLAKTLLAAPVIAISVSLLTAHGVAAATIEASDDPAANVSAIQNAINADGATVVELGCCQADLPGFLLLLR